MDCPARACCSGRGARASTASAAAPAGHRCYCTTTAAATATHFRLRFRFRWRVPGRGRCRCRAGGGGGGGGGGVDDGGGVDGGAGCSGGSRQRSTPTGSDHAPAVGRRATCPRGCRATTCDALGSPVRRCGGRRRGAAWRWQQRRWLLQPERGLKGRCKREKYPRPAVLQKAPVAPYSSCACASFS